MAFFPTYFENVWKRESNQIYNDACIKFMNGGLDLAEAAAEAVNEKLPQLVREALQDMFNSKVENGIKKERDIYQNAY
jgi:hypothetical protein